MIEIKKLKTIIPYASNSYLISSGQECAVVDPSGPFDPKQLDGKDLNIDRYDYLKIEVDN